MKPITLVRASLLQVHVYKLSYPDLRVIDRENYEGWHPAMKSCDGYKRRDVLADSQTLGVYQLGERVSVPVLALLN
jgi:hypothetical protein